MKTCKRLTAPMAAASLFAALLVAPEGRAQEPTPAPVGAQDKAAARSLFDEGRSLLRSGHYTEACPKLEAASKLFAGPGVVLNLADCHEKIGRTASAWSEFGEAAALAARANRPDQAREARRRQAALEPKLARLVVRVPHPVPGLAVVRDGASLEAGAWGEAIPVDPGSHEIRAEAPGREAWSLAVVVPAGAQPAPIEVPELQDRAAAVAAPVPAEPRAPEGTAAEPKEAALPPARESKPERARPNGAAFALIGGGVAVAAGGAVLMGLESARASDARSRGDQREYDTTKLPWAVGLGCTIAGGVALAAGVVVLAAHGPSGAQSSALRAWPWVGAGGGGFELGGDF